MTDSDGITAIALALRDRYGRMPTEEEVRIMIFGTEEERLEVWNYGRPNSGN